MAGKETYFDKNSGTYNTRQTRTAEDVARAQDKDKFQNFRAPDSGGAPKFQAPKQRPGESLASWSARVKEARAAFEENDTAASQKQALSKMEEPK